MERTLAIIKPDAMEAGHEITIVHRIEAEGFVILDSKIIHLDKVYLPIPLKSSAHISTYTNIPHIFQ